MARLSDLQKFLVSKNPNKIQNQKLQVVLIITLKVALLEFLIIWIISCN